MSLPRDIEDLVGDRTQKDAEPILRTFLVETLERKDLRYDLYFARSGEPTGIRFYVGDEKLMNVFPGNSVQVAYRGDVSEDLPHVFAVGPEYISLKVRNLPLWTRELDSLRDATYARITGGL